MVSSWGRVDQSPHNVSYLKDRTAISQVLSKELPGLAYGMGRSYGDVCLNPGGNLWNTLALERFIAFDPENGILICETGTLLRDIQNLVVPSGWMLAVSPGTQMVTVGGAIANDVHGKNHHIFGSFGDHVRAFSLHRTDGELLNCSEDENADWFAATIGGMGLTGVIVTAEIQLRKIDSAWLDVESIPYHSLDDFFEIADESESDWEYTVSWIDCRDRGGRGIFTRSNHSVSKGREPPGEAEFSIPFAPPVSLVNSWSLNLFNELYFRYNSFKAGRSVQHYKSLFYPLDKISNWNLMYGPKGFYQYQSVVPRAVGKDAIKAMYDEIVKAGEGSFLVVLKMFGNRESKGLMSFPQPGVTLALDFTNLGQSTLQLFERLDAVVREACGRVYPAKDNRMPKNLFEAGYPNLNQFTEYRDPGISSSMSRRLMGN